MLSTGLFLYLILPWKASAKIIGETALLPKKMHADTVNASGATVVKGAASCACHAGQ